jgi:GDP-D-mannose 3',5'-epimerase
MRVLIAGSGGFIGGYLVKRLLDEGHKVRAVDIKPFSEWWQQGQHIDRLQHHDLRVPRFCVDACRNIDHVYNFACDMGGMGFIERYKADCMVSVLINTNLLRAAYAAGVKRYFYSSSACVYAACKQNRVDLPALKEADAWPAEPEPGYGLEKLFSEKFCYHAMEDWGIETRVARFHNVYGPHGSWNDERTKAPAAICRKVAEAVLSGNHVIDIWGDGSCTRSFMDIEDCLVGIRKIMDSEIKYPINLGSSQVVSVDQLVGIVEDIAGVKLERRYDTSQPQGVAGRNSDNELIQIELSWQPNTPLIEGMTKLYEWVFQKVKEKRE